MRVPILVVLAIVFLSGMVPASSQQPATRGTNMTSSVGMEMTYFLRHSGEALRAIPTRDNSPLVIFISDQADEGGSTIYEIRYVGTLPGTYNLADFLERLDGKPHQLTPLPVTIESILPEDHNGDLETIESPPLPRIGGYTLFLFGAGSLWILGLFVFLFRSRKRRPKITREEVVAEITTADHLRSLVEKALSEGPLDTEDQARLELLLIDHWKTELAKPDLTPSEAMRALKAHPEASKLLLALERWLHQRPDQRDVDVAGLLSPYLSRTSEANPSAPGENVP